jgi:hypothetical protein
MSNVAAEELFDEHITDADVAAYKAAFDVSSGR